MSLSFPNSASSSDVLQRKKDFFSRVLFYHCTSIVFSHLFYSRKVIMMKSKVVVLTAFLVDLTRYRFSVVLQLFGL